MRDEIENTQAAWEWAIQKASLKHLRPVTTAFGLYYSWRGGIQEGEQVFQTFAKQLIDSSKKQEPESMFLRSDILNWQAYFLYELGDRPKAIDLLLESLESINSPSMTKMDTRDVLAHNLVNRSRAGWWQTSDERIELISLSRALYRDVDHPFGLPDVLNTSANLSLVTGQLADAQRYYEESLQLNERAGNLLGKSSSMVGLGSLTFALNDYEKAEKILVQAVKISGVMEDLYRVASALLSLGCVYLHSGQFSHARRTLERCAADFTDMSLKNNIAVSLYYLGFACLHLGEYEQAAFYANAALPLALGTDYKEIIAQSMMLPAAIKLARGEYKEAVHGFEAANQVFISKRYTRILFGEDPGKIGQAAALLGLARQEEAKILLADQLRLAVDAHRMDSLLYGLVGAALLMARLGDGKSAIRLYTQACNYRFVTDSCWFSEAFGRHIKIACASLSTTEREAAVEKGKLSDIWETAGELIQILSINNQ
jgi:tetratricopeptide (TPR) repeat protein